MKYIQMQREEYTVSERSDVYGIPTAQITDCAVPDVEDCSTDNVPYKGTREIIVPDFNSMFKYMFNRELANKRLEMYSYLNRLLRRGQLSQIVGFPVNNRVVNRETCAIKDVSFWKISRIEFFADVEIELTLHSYGNVIQWRGYLVCWCGFADQFYMSIEELSDVNYHREANMIPLSPFLVPYYKNKQMDAVAEKLWEGCVMPEAITNPLDAVERRETRNEMLAAMTDKQREVFILFYREGMTQEQIAAVFGLSRRTIREHLTCAFERAKNFFEIDPPF